MNKEEIIKEVVEEYYNDKTKYDPSDETMIRLTIDKTAKAIFERLDKWLQTLDNTFGSELDKAEWYLGIKESYINRRIVSK